MKGETEFFTLKGGNRVLNSEGGEDRHLDTGHTFGERSPTCQNKGTTHTQVIGSSPGFSPAKRSKKNLDAGYTLGKRGPAC